METSTLGARLPSRLALVVGLVVLSFFAATAGAVWSNVLFPTASAVVLYDEEAVVTLYEKASPAVVEITVTEARSGRARFSLPAQGQGSGFLVDTDGHILTNYHVVQGADRIRVTLFDGETLDARVVGASSADDLALLKVDPQAVASIKPLSLGDSSAAKPGQMAIALGSPFGLQNSITIGVVSGVERSKTSGVGRPITGMIQTDAAINPGNSGGPLLNSRGEVVGINTAIEADSNGGATGVGFAIPSNTAKSVLGQILASGEVKRPWLGISGVALSQDLADQLGLPASRGIYVVAVVPDSPAAAAGLRAAGVDPTTGGPGAGGDVITAVDGRRVRSVLDVASYLNGLRPGDTVTLTVIRHGETLQLSAALGAWPEGLGR